MKNFFENYFNELKNLISLDYVKIKKLEEVKKILRKTKLSKNKVIIFGNGGSAELLIIFL